MTKLAIPPEVLRVTETLEQAGFEAYVVGGCVRDLLIGRTPKDWDVTTSARPEEIAPLFPKTFYENAYGTVSVVWEDVSDETLKVIEVTPYRIEGKYSNKRHPDEVFFSKDIKDDLERRDFTINAIAYRPKDSQLIDLFNGQADLDQKIVRAVGDPIKRFEEDALRMLRAIRIATELGFEISRETLEAIQQNAANIKEIAIERVQTEITRVTMSDHPKRGFELSHVTGLLQYIIPELEEGICCAQNQAHSFDVWEHNLRSVEHAATRGWPLHVRLGALLHDVGKPKARRWGEEKKDWTFYGHDVVGAKIAKKVLERLKYSGHIIDIVEKLVKNHMFFSDVDKITMSAVRRIVSKMGPEYVWDLMHVRACDRIGTGRPKEAPYRLRKYEAMIEEAMRDPITVGTLKIDGKELMETVHMKPGPRMGSVLHALLEEVLENPEKNTKEYLVTRATELEKLSDEELKALGEAGKSRKEEIEAEEIAEIRKKHWVE